MADCWWFLDGVEVHLVPIIVWDLFNRGHLEVNHQMPEPAPGKMTNKNGAPSYTFQLRSVSSFRMSYRRVYFQSNQLCSSVFKDSVKNLELLFMLLVLGHFIPQLPTKQRTSLALSFLFFRSRCHC